MEISKKTDYALRMLATLVRDPSGIMSVRAAADDNGVPYSFARSIQHDLANAGIVQNTRGANGGMRLVVDPRQTTLLQVVEAVQGPVSIANCEKLQRASADDPATPRVCARLDTCHFSPAFCTAEQMLRELFAAVTIYDLVVEDRAPVFEGHFATVPADEARSRIGIFSVPEARPAAQRDAGLDG